MTVQYIHLDYEAYKKLELQMKAFEETTHATHPGFYHASIRLQIDENLIIEFHGPLVKAAEEVPMEAQEDKRARPKYVAGQVSFFAGQSLRSSLMESAVKSALTLELEIERRLIESLKNFPSPPRRSPVTS